MSCLVAHQSCHHQSQTPAELCANAGTAPALPVVADSVEDQQDQQIKAGASKQVKQ